MAPDLRNNSKAIVPPRWHEEGRSMHREAGLLSCGGAADKDRVKRTNSRIVKGRARGAEIMLATSWAKATSSRVKATSKVV